MPLSRRGFLGFMGVGTGSAIAASAKSAKATDIDPNAGVSWCWLGGVGDRQITIKAKIKKGINPQSIQIKFSSNAQDFKTQKSFNALFGVAADSLVGQIATFNLQDLIPDQRYYYVIVAGGRRYPAKSSSKQGQYLTFKTVKVGEPYNFAIACSSCAGGTVPGILFNKGISDSKIFDTIRKHRNPSLDLFIHMGDLHYQKDILGAEKTLEDFRDNYHQVLSQARQRNLYQNIPLAYVWDDHDYGKNNSDGTSEFKSLAAEAYREQVPHYPLDSTGAIYQSFAIGRVRFIMTDSRFHKDALNKENNFKGKTLLGAEQKQWFFEQLKIAKENQLANKEGLVIWVNSLPWIAGDEDYQTNDAWDCYPEERAEIANFIKDNGIDKLLMISGDAHMLALDDGKDGTANSYAKDGGGSFPVLQIASLDSKSSEKGGPYSRKPIPGLGQWGVLTFIDDGMSIEVKVELKRKNETLIAHDFTF